MQLTRLIFVYVLLARLGPTLAHGTDFWPQFRGSGADGVVSGEAPTTWNASENIRWKVPLVGEGWSSPVIWGDSVFVTLAERIDDEEEIASSRPVPYTGGGGWQRSDLTEAKYRWQVVCFDAASGQEQWRRTARSGTPPLPRHSSNTYATESPITDGERLYVYFGMNGVFCYDLQGELLWERDLGVYEMRAGWGTASSPALLDDKLFVQVDNEEQSFVIALDAASGEEIWRANREEPSQYSSPIIWRNSLRDELIVGGQVYRSYDPSTGDLLWRLDMAKGRSSATPLASGDVLFVGTELRNRGGPDDGGGFYFAVTPGGMGDITPGDGVGRSGFTMWKAERSGIQMASPMSGA